MTSMIKTFSELSRIDGYLKRYRYLKLKGIVAHDTFGSKRWLNQEFYRSREWRSFRNDIIIRDKGCDLGLEGYPIDGKIIIHHINPLEIEDFYNSSPKLFDPDNVVCVSHRTHQAIHYGDESLLYFKECVERKPNDTIPWK